MISDVLLDAGYEIARYLELRPEVYAEEARREVIEVLKVMDQLRATLDDVSFVLPDDSPTAWLEAYHARMSGYLMSGDRNPTQLA